VNNLIRRKTNRKKLFHTKCKVKFKNMVIDADAINISEIGMLLKANAVFEMEDIVTIMLKNTNIAGKIKHINSNQVGIQFDCELSMLDLEELN